MSGRRHSLRVERLAREVAELVAGAGHHVYAREVRTWLEEQGRGTGPQVYAAGRVAEDCGWVVRHGKDAGQLVWAAPEVEQAAPEGAS